jgi:hypothetical protein
MVRKPTSNINQQPATNTPHLASFTRPQRELVGLENKCKESSAYAEAYLYYIVLEITATV